MVLKFRVGLFVFVLLLLFVTFVLTIGIQTRLFEEQYMLRAAFRDIQGLVAGAPVRLAGLTVGTVQRITFGADIADPRIHVEVGVDRRFQSRIREDSVATIGTMGLVGDKIFEISVGSEQGKVLEPGDHLQSNEPIDFVRLVSRGGEVMEGLSGASQALKKILQSLEEGRGLLPALISKEAGGEMIRDLAVAAKNLRTLSERAERGEGLLGALLTDQKEAPLLESVRRSAARLEEILTEVQEGDGLLHAVIYDEGGRALVTDGSRAVRVGAEALQDLRVAAANLKEITTALAEGRGTLGALLHDPTVYEDLSSLLRGAERSWILRGLIRSSVREGGDSVGKEKK
jgi:phospholipid/cholesterol/gamma-HCH transport system substrate-binding protein